jgi:hypothetical protein
VVDDDSRIDTDVVVVGIIKLKASQIDKQWENMATRPLIKSIVGAEIIFGFMNYMILSVLKNINLEK